MTVINKFELSNSVPGTAMTRRYSQNKIAPSATHTEVREVLDSLLQHQKIREIDRSFALFAAQQCNVQDNQQSLLLTMTAALLSEQLGQQHVCLELSTIKQPFAPIYRFPVSGEITDLFSCAEVAETGLFQLSQARLYLSRYYHYEQDIVAKLNGLSAPQFPETAIKDCMDKLYGKPSNDAEPDWQKTAVALACLKSVAVIAGGPGTGKTTTVVRILWALSQLSQVQGQHKPIIKMVAPTGKAAARLSESVSGAVSKLPSQDDNLPLECSTIHRLLGARPGSVFFRHNAEHKLNIDVLVVDEASMIDMPLLAKLLAALPQHCRLILLGDSHQLASVEVGSVFSDICSLKSGENQFSPQLQQLLSQLSQQQNLAEERYVLPAMHTRQGFIDNIIYLQKSWRFDANSGVGKLAQAINAGDVAQTMQVLTASRDDIEWHASAALAEFIRAILPHFETFHEVVAAGNVAGAFEVLSRCQVLAVQRSGKWGTLNLNKQIQQVLLRADKIKGDAEFYAGRPIMITSNDYQNRLFNGDIGIVMSAAGEDGLLKVWFADTEQGYRSLLPAQLPAHETLYAMTTHKSQGSEFDKVLMCLPESVPGVPARVNRELLYTGVTRAKKEFVLFADEQAVRNAVSLQCLRASGLAKALTGGAQ